MEDIDAIMNQSGFKQVEKGVADKNEQVKTETAPKVETTTTEKSVQANTESEKGETKSEDVFNIEHFNKAFGKEYKDIEEIKSIFSQKDEYQTLKAQLAEKETMIEEKEKAFKEQYDPMSYFADEQQYIINQVLKNNKGLNRDVITKLVNANIADLKDVDVLKLNELLTTKGKFDEGVVERVINKKYGLNVSKEDLDEEGLKDYEAQMFIMNKDAEEVREKLTKLLDIQKPEFKDPLMSKKEHEAELAKAYNSKLNDWNGFSNKFVNEFKSFAVEYELDDKSKVQYDVQVADDFRKVLATKLPELAAKSGLDINNKDHVTAIVEQVKKDYLWIKKDAILRSFRDDLVSKMTEDEFKKYHNPSQLKNDVRPETLSGEEKFNKDQKTKMLNDFKI